MGNALKSMPSLEATHSVELDVGGRPFVFLLLNGAEAVRRASPMLDRLLRSVDVDVWLCCSAGDDILCVGSESLGIGVNEKLRLGLVRICGTVVLEAGCSSRMGGCPTICEVAIFDLLGKTSYVGLRYGRADSLFIVIVIGRRRPTCFSELLPLLKISPVNECGKSDRKVHWRAGRH